MIDLIKSYSIPITIPELLQNPRLQFPLNAFEGGEINDRNQTADYNGIRITINKVKSFVNLKGSIHVHWNGGAHNYNDFHFSDLVKTIRNLSEELNLDPKKCRINHIEYGVNLVTDFDPNELIGDLIQHRGIPFCTFPIGIGKSCTHSQYIIKIYDKGSQRGLNYHILRIENKVNAMEYLQSRGIPIYTFADLTETNNLRLLGQDLLERFNGILFYDSTIETGELTETEQLILSNSRISENWASTIDKNIRNQLRKKYNSLYERIANRKWQKIVSPMIKNKLIELLSEKTNVKESSLKVFKDNNDMTICPDKTPNGPIVYVSDSVSLSNPIIISNNSLTNKVSDSVFSVPDQSNKAGNNNEVSDSVFDNIEFWEKEIDELESFMQNRPLPETTIHLNAWTRITDVKLFMDSSLSTIIANKGNKTYLPYLTRLIQLKEYLIKFGLGKHIEETISPQYPENKM